MARFYRRTQNIPVFTNYRSYKPYLRIDFARRCAYCETTEASGSGITAFGVDHFRPRKLFPELDCVYPNLYYCCNDCNRYKGAAWPHYDLAARGFFFPDPCMCDPQLDHLKENEFGLFMAVTNAGAFLLESLRLNRQACVRFRQRRALAHRRILECRSLLKEVIAPIAVGKLLEQILLDLETEWLECFAAASAVATRL